MPHIHEKIDFTTEVFIVYKNKVLLRRHDKLKIWLSIGGKIELNENPEDAAMREVSEEVGLDVDIVGYKSKLNDEHDYKHLISPRHLAIWQAKSGNKYMIFVYFAKAKTNVIFESKNEHERAECCWATLKELEKMNLRSNVLFYAQEALKELGEK